MTPFPTSILDAIGPGPVRRHSTAVGLALAFLAVRLVGFAAAANLEEYEVKAAFLYNFAKFVQWPDEAFEKPESPFLICIAGKDPFGKTLDGLVRGKTANDRAISIRRLSKGEEPRWCQMLFVPRSEPKDAPKLPNLPHLLAIGERTGFLKDGGVINLISADSKIRFEIDLGNAEKSKLKISSKLLNLAVKSEK